MCPSSANCAAFSEAVFRYLESYNIGHHFLERVGEGRMRVRRLTMLPLTVHVRNLAAGDMVERFSLQEGQVLDYPVIEHYLKRPGLSPTMVNPSHCLAFQLATDEELKALGRLASKVNAVLRSFFDRRDLVLVDLIDRQGRVILTNLNTAQAGAAGALERIANQAIPVHYAIFVRAMAWFFGILVCTRLDTAGHDSVLGIVVGVLIMTLFIVAERLGHFIEEPMRNTIMDLPMYRFCATITGDLLGPDHPLARPREGADASVWR